MRISPWITDLSQVRISFFCRKSGINSRTHSFFSLAQVGLVHRGFEQICTVKEYKEALDNIQAQGLINKKQISDDEWEYSIKTAREIVR